MIMKAFMISAAVIVGLMIVLLSCQVARAGEPSYVFQEVEDGVLRLDENTGTVSHCRHEDDEWQCVSVKDDQERLRQRIATLEQENSQLRQALEDSAEQDIIPPDVGLSSVTEMDQIMNFFTEFVRRFKDIIGVLREDFETRQIPESEYHTAPVDTAPVTEF